MNRTLSACLGFVFALLGAVVLCGTLPAVEQRPNMIHPGISHRQESIEFIKAKLAEGQQPWKDAWAELNASKLASLEWTARPRAHVERGAYNRPDIGGSDFLRDGSAAYTHAIQWVLAGNEAHAGKAAEILDAWSQTLKSVTNHDAKLLIGMAGHKYCNAAELLKHTWDGWPEENQKQFQSMLRNVWYPVIKDFYPSANGNWDASMLQTMIAMGVFLDDRAMFDRAVNYFREGEGNGAIRNYFNEFGECQESGRDQAHTQMGLEFLANTCETGWSQGVDLYGELDNRLLKGFEYTARYNLGFDVPYEPFKSFEGRYHYKSISDKSRGRLRPMYEKVFNHYHNRRGLDAPYTAQAISKVRLESGGRGSSLPWGTLMFANQPPLLLTLGQRDANPLDELPSYIRKINDWGQRADFSHDGKRILFIEKTYGDAFELNLASGGITPVTHHYYHGGYTRALYLSNGDILLSGCTDFDADNPHVNRYDKAELWILDKTFTEPPVRLGTHCFEGPAVSRKNLRIAWTTEYRQYPDTYADGELRVHVGDIVYENGTPQLANRRLVLSNISNEFFDKPMSIETQNFVGPDENRITMSIYGAGTVASVDLETGEVNRVSTIAHHHNEPEGIFPDGKHTLVESSRQFAGEKLRSPVQYIDIWKLSLDGNERWERITHFTDYTGYKSSNPVVSDDGRFIAFQMARLGDPAGVGRGLFLLDIGAMEATKR